MVRPLLSRRQRAPRPLQAGPFPDIPITIARERAQRIIAEAHGGKDHSAQRKDDRAAHSVRELGALYVDNTHAETLQADVAPG